MNIIHSSNLSRVPFAMMLITLLSGCASPPGTIFPAVDPPLVWPAAPEAARIRYVGNLLMDTDLKPAKPMMQSLGEVIFGRKTAQSMLSPYAICTDGGSRLFVADSNAQLVHVFDLGSRIYARWVSPGGMSQPVGIAYDPSGRLFVADSVAGSIEVFSAAGKHQGSIGAGIVKRPCGMAFDVARGRLLVADSGAHDVVMLSPTGHMLGRFGGRGTALGQFNYPTNVAVDSVGRIYVSDSLNFRVQQFSPELKALRQVGGKGDMPGYLSQPKGIAVDSDNHLYIVDAQFEAVQIFAPDGNLLMDWGQEGRRPGEFWLPAGIHIDQHNRIWVADVYNRRVQVFDYLPETKP